VSTLIDRWALDLVWCVGQPVPPVSGKSPPTGNPALAAGPVRLCSRHWLL